MAAPLLQRGPRGGVFFLDGDKKKYLRREETEQETEAQQQRFLIGPVSVSKHVKDLMEVYILGDVHVKETECPTVAPEQELQERKQTQTVTEWLQELIANHQKDAKVVDVFFESPFISEAQPRRLLLRDSYLADVLRTHEACLEVKKAGCPYLKQAHFHYADIRSLFAQHFPSTYALYGALQRLQVDLALRKPNPTDLKLVLDYEAPTDEKSFIEAVLEATKLNRQMRAALTNATGTKLKRILERLIREIKERWRVFASLLPTKKAAILSYSKEKEGGGKQEETRHVLRLTLEASRAVKALREPLSEFLALLVDIYLISRVFRYKKAKKSKNKHVVIIYAGDAHSQQYRRIFKELGFKEEFSARSDESGDRQCVNITRI